MSQQLFTGTVVDSYWLHRVVMCFVERELWLLG